MANVNELGKFLRKIRIDCDENLKDMADKFGYAPSYLSSIESGKRNIPNTLLGKVVENYTLTAEQKANLDLMIKRCVPTYEVANDGNPQLQEVLIKMADKEVSAAQYEQILKLLSKK